MKSYSKIFSIALGFLILFLGCNEKDDETEIDNIEYICCGTNPFSSENINNLEEEIVISSFISVNGDGINDAFLLNYTGPYSIVSVSILDLDDNVIFFEENYEINFPAEVNTIKNGTYKYEVIIEDKSIFFQQGYVCVVKDLNGALQFKEKTNCDFVETDPFVF